jgi:hypothetical protein
MLEHSFSLDENEEKGTAGAISPPKLQETHLITMVIDTISSVKSREILKLLLDSGSTTTLINRKSLPRHCQACVQD